VRLIDCASIADRDSAVALAVSTLKAGELIVFPTDSVYGVACDAFSPAAVERLNEAKHRVSGDNVPVMIGSVRTIDGIVTGLSGEARTLLRGCWPGPLTARCLAQPSLKWDLGGDDATVAVRMPLHPLAIAICAAFGPLAVLAANTTGLLPPQICADAMTQLGESVACYFDAGPCAASKPSTIVDLTTSPPRLLRRGSFDPAVLTSMLPSLVVPEDSGSE